MTDKELLQHWIDRALKYEQENIRIGAMVLSLKMEIEELSKRDVTIH